MKGTLEVKNGKILESRFITIKNPHVVAEMNIKKGNKFMFEGKEHVVTLFLKSDSYLFIDIDEVEN